MREKIVSFFNSKLFVFFVMALAILNWSLQTIYLYIPISIILVYCIILLNIDRLKIIPIILAGIICFQLDSVESYIIPLSGMLIFLLPIFTYDIIVNKNKRVDIIFVSLLLFGLALISSTVRTLSFLHSFIGVVQIFFLLGIYYYAYLFKKKNSDDNYEKAISFNLICFGIAIIIETIISLFLLNNFETYKLNLFSLGWGSYATVSVIFIIIVFVLIGNYSKNSNSIKIPIIINLFIIFFLFLMTRGAYIAFLLLIIPCSLDISKNFADKNKMIKFTTISLITVLCVILLIGIPLGIVSSVIDRLSNVESNFINLEVAFNEEFRAFLLNPIYGTGIFTSHYYFKEAVPFLGNGLFSSNSIIQILSSLGLVGFSFLVYFLFTIFKKVTYRTIYNKIIFYILLAFIIVGFFEVVFLNMSVMIPLVLLLAGINEKEKIDMIERNENV